MLGFATAGGFGVLADDEPPAAGRPAQELPADRVEPVDVEPAVDPIRPLAPGGMTEVVAWLKSNGYTRIETISVTPESVRVVALTPGSDTRLDAIGWHEAGAPTSEPEGTVSDAAGLFGLSGVDYDVLPAAVTKAPELIGTETEVSSVEIGTDSTTYVEALTQAHVDGRLDAATFEERVAAAEQATSFDDLDRLVADVPFDDIGPAERRIRRANRRDLLLGVAGFVGVGASELSADPALRRRRGADPSGRHPSVPEPHARPDHPGNADADPDRLRHARRRTDGGRDVGRLPRLRCGPDAHPDRQRHRARDHPIRQSGPSLLVGDRGGAGRPGPSGASRLRRGIRARARGAAGP